MVLVLGFEGSANKLGIGIVNEKGEILSNVRDTYITEAGEGFKPNETAKHHRDFIIKLTKDALKEANVSKNDITALAYTKGPGFVFFLCFCFFFFFFFLRNFAK